MVCSGVEPRPRLRDVRVESSTLASHIEAGMTTLAHPTKKGYGTIRLPLTESAYDRFLTDRSEAKARLEERYEECAAWFPDAFPWGYALCGYTEPSSKQQLLGRRI